MANIINTVKGLLTPEIIGKVSSSLGEDSSKVTSAISAIVPGLLGSIISSGGSSKLEGLLHQAGSNKNFMSGAMDLLSGKENGETSTLGGKITNLLLGTKQEGFETAIAKHSGISKGGIGKIIAMVSPLIAGVIGSKLSSGSNLKDIARNLSSDKSALLGGLPTGMLSSLGLTSIPEMNIKTPEHRKTGGGRGGWIKWLLIILGLLLLFFGWRSCKKCSKDHQVVNEIENVSEKAVAKVENIIKREHVELKLPDGVTLNAFKGGIEEQLIKFISSDDFKNATPEVLKEKWFNFDSIEFKFGSATELTPGSQAQLDNLATVLKHYNVKFKIGAYTDKVGSAESNIELSQKRADTLKKLFEAKGLTTQVAGAEGYGEQFAKYPEDAPESDRANDRKLSISIRK